MDGRRAPDASRAMQDLKTRVARDEYEVDPHRVAEALLRRVGERLAHPEGREERISRRGARDRRAPGSGALPDLGA